jgi:chromosome segregation ATPase
MGTLYSEDEGCSREEVMAMRRADRRTSSHENTVRNPQSQQTEPLSTHELKQLLPTLRAQKNELQQKVQETEQRAEQIHHLYLEEQGKYQSTLTLYQEEHQKYESTLTLYEEAQTQVQSYLALYDQEKARSGELLVKYETAQAERDRYLTLYEETKAELKFERRSKAGIKGWETRRKRENERLKQEIGEMSVLLRDSITRRDAAIGNLEELANRMDRIQNLVDSVESGSGDTPVNLVQKFKRIWQAIQDILAE